MVDQSVDLFTQFGDGGRLPNAALANGADGEERIRNRSVASDQRSGRRNIQTEKERVGPGQTRGQKR